MVSDLPEPGCARSDHHGVALTVLGARFASPEPMQRRGVAPALLVASDDLDTPTVRFGEQGEVPDDVEQVRWSEHAGDEQFLPG